MNSCWMKSIQPTVCSWWQMIGLSSRTDYLPFQTTRDILRDLEVTANMTIHHTVLGMQYRKFWIISGRTPLGLGKVCKRRWLFFSLPIVLFSVLHPSLPIRQHPSQVLWEIFKPHGASSKPLNSILKAAVHSFYAACQPWSSVNTSNHLNFSALKTHLSIYTGEPENEFEGVLTREKNNTLSYSKRKLLCKSCLG